MDQLGGVPVGEAETAVGTGAGDIFRLGRAVNAIPLKGETDPGRAHGVVRSGRKNETVGDALLLSGEGEDLGVEGVVRIGGDVGDGERLVRDLGFIGGNGTGKAGDDLVVGVESEEGGLRNHDDDATDGRKFAGALKVGNGELGADGDVREIS